MSDERRPVPADALECRQRAEEALTEPDPLTACAFALLAIAAELATIRRTATK